MMNDIKFDYQPVWTGSYREAQQRNFQYLPDRCCICLGDYLPKDQVKVFPCSHALHFACAESLDKQRQICPFDGHSILSAKITYIGKSVLFNYEENLLLFHLFKKYKDLFIAYFEQEAQRRGAFSPEEKEGVKREMMEALQKFVEDYAKGHQAHNWILPLSWENLERILLFLQEKGEVDLSCDEHRSWIVCATLRGEEGIMDKSMKRLLNGIPSPSPLQERVEILKWSIDCSLWHWHFEPTVGHIRLESFAQRINQLFYQSHCQALEKLSSPEECKAYLNKMDFSRASRLKELSLANHTPVKIQEKVNAVFKDVEARVAREKKLLFISILFVMVIVQVLYSHFFPTPHQS